MLIMYNWVMHASVCLCGYVCLGFGQIENDMHNSFSLYLLVCLSVSVSASVCLCLYLSVCLSVCLSLTVLYKISMDCFCFLFQYQLHGLIRCSAALVAGCMLIMCNRVMYAGVHLALWTRCFVWKFLCITFHSLIHAYMYTNDACNFIFTHQKLSKD